MAKTQGDDIALTILGRNLKKYRLESGLSYRKLATLADTDTSQILRIEKGEINTSVSFMFKLAKALNIKPIQLLEEDLEN